MPLTIHGLPPRLTSALIRTLGEASTRAYVCIAGTGPITAKSFEDLSGDEWSAQVRIVRDACFAAQKTARDAIAAGQAGRIVFVVHSPTIRAVAGATTAAVAGAFLSTFAQVGGIETVARNVTFNTLVAGWTDESAPAQMVAAIPAGRYATIDEIVSAIMYLASAAAGYVTGATLTVDGGFVVSKAGGGSPLLASRS